MHLCGKGKLDNLYLNTPGYIQFEYVKGELKDLFALADIVVSRAGANAICELLALRKPNLLIPLPSSNSRGDQMLNAKSFEAQGYSMVLDEADMTREVLVEKINTLFDNRISFLEAMDKSSQKHSIPTIMKLIEDAVLPKE